MTLNRAVGGHEPARGRDRRARGGADRVAADRRRRSTRDRCPRDRARRASRRCGCACSRSCASRACTSSPSGCVDDEGALLPETLDVLDVVARHGMVLAHRPPRPRRDLRGGRRRRRDGRRDDRRHPPRVPRPGHRRRRPGRGSPTAARCSSAASRRRTPARSPGSACSRRSARPAPSARCSSTDLGQVFNPPVEDGLAADGRPAARRRLRRGGDPHDGRDQHAPAGGSVGG